MMDSLVYLEKLFLAIFLGGIIGIERENNDKPAGMRTIILLVLAGTVITLFSEVMIGRGLIMDAIRAPSYMISGMGFLGAGIIMSKGSKLEGITTAALLLVLVPLGFIIGIGEYGLAISVTFVIYVVLKLKHIEKLFITNKKVKKNGKTSNNLRRRKINKRRVAK